MSTHVEATSQRHSGASNSIPAAFSDLRGLRPGVGTAPGDGDGDGTGDSVSAIDSAVVSSRGRDLRGAWKARVPGLAVTGAAVAIAWAVAAAEPVISPLTCAVVLGAVAANLRLLPAWARPGLGFAGKRLMRIGIVLLGLRLALGDVVALGWRTLAATLVVVAATFLGTWRLGRRMGLPGDQPLLVATGFSICGASAVAAMNCVTDSEEDDVVGAVALVTLCGTLAIAVLPLLHHPLGLTDLQFGRWVGASVHDVGQVVAAAQTAGPAALDQAVVVKLMRIAMLAPLVAGVAAVKRRKAAGRPGPAAAAGARRPAPVPLFVLGFLAMVAIRSGGVLPAGAISLAQTLANLSMAAGLFALGAAVDVRRLVRTGGRLLALGLSSWALIAIAAYAAVRLTT